MKRIILLLACLVGMATTLPAQRAHSTTKTSKAKKQKGKVELTWGVRAGMNFANVLNAPDGNGRIGFNVGGSLDVGINNWFHVETGLYLSQKGVEAEYQYYEYGEGMNQWEEHNRGRFAPIYLELPVLASFHVDLGRAAQLQVGVGPYVALALNDDVYFYQRGGSSHAHPYIDSKLSRFDAGVQASLGVAIKHFYIGAGYQIGLPSTTVWWNQTRYSYSEQVCRTSNVMINVGYNF